MSQLLSTISTICYVVAAVLLIVSAALFVVNKIPQVIGDLSGRNMLQNIHRIRQENEKKTKQKSGLARNAAVSATEKKEETLETGVLREESRIIETIEETAVLDTVPQIEQLFEGTQPLCEETVLLNSEEESDTQKKIGVKIKVISETIMNNSKEIIE